MSWTCVSGIAPTFRVMSSGEIEIAVTGTAAAGRGKSSKRVVAPPRTKAIASAPANFRCFTEASYVLDVPANRGQLCEWGQIRWLPSWTKPVKVEVRKVTGREHSVWPSGRGFEHSKPGARAFWHAWFWVKTREINPILTQFRFTTEGERSIHIQVCRLRAAASMQQCACKRSALLWF